MISSRFVGQYKLILKMIFRTFPVMTDTCIYTWSNLNYFTVVILFVSLGSPKENFCFPRLNVRKQGIFVNHAIFFFKECLPGFLGENCSNMCEYPTFGKRCTQQCPCDKHLCNLTLGCTKCKRFFLFSDLKY